jgi:hypothetical protein
LNDGWQVTGSDLPKNYLNSVAVDPVNLQD